MTAAKLDWSAPCDPDGRLPGVDVVLASDVMYDAAAVQPLVSLAPRLFSPDAVHPRLLLADPEHRTRHHR